MKVWLPRSKVQTNLFDKLPSIQEILKYLPLKSTLTFCNISHNGQLRYSHLVTFSELWKLILKWWLLLLKKQHIDSCPVQEVFLWLSASRPAGTFWQCVCVRKKECVSACVQQYVDLAVPFPLFQSLHNADHSRKMWQQNSCRDAVVLPQGGRRHHNRLEMLPTQWSQ